MIVCIKSAGTLCHYPDCECPRTPKLLDNNPKTAEAARVKKRPVHLVPLSMVEAAAGPFSVGAAKYGPFNWRHDIVHSSTYIGAAIRHLQEYQDGVVADKETGECHLHSVLACIAIIVDAKKHGKLVDDRASGMYPEWVKNRVETTVKKEEK